MTVPDLHQVALFAVALLIASPLAAQPPANTGERGTNAGGADASSNQRITITPIEARSTIRGPAQAYTGPAIAEILFGATASSPLTAVEVTFEPGARTAWHNHPAGQYLVVTSGIGWVQERGGEKREVRAGDVVWTPPGVAHWHGATTTHSMSHLAIWQFVDGSGGELFEHVSDDDYLAAPATD